MLEATYLANVSEGSGILSLTVNDSKGGKMVGDDFKVKPGSSPQKKSYVFYMTKSDGQTVSGRAKLAVSKSVDGEQADDKKLAFVAEKGNKQVGGRSTVPSSGDEVLEEKRHEVRMDYQKMLAMYEEGQAHGYDLSSVTERVEAFPSRIDAAKTEKELNVIKLDITVVTERMKTQFQMTKPQK